MKESRTKNSVRNIIWGLANKIINIVLPFGMRTIIIYALGIQYVGLNSLFSSILGVLNLAELGIGTALTFALYEPAAENDYEKFGKLLKYYKKCYRVIGSIILLIGIAILPFISFFIKGDYPSDINIYILYLVYLFNTVISYFMFAYKGAVLVAYQRNDIKSNISSVLQIIMYIIQIILLLITKNYYFYIIITPISTIVLNVITSMYVDKLYPNIKSQGEIDKSTKKDLKNKVKGMFFQKIGSIVLNSVDNIVISSFLGLSVLAIYSNYYLIITSILGVLSVITASIIPSVGNAIKTKTVEENYKDFNCFNFIYLWLVSWFAICLLCLYQPFMTFWIKSEEMILPNTTMFLFVCYFFICKWMDMNYVYQEAAGLWWENRFVPFIAAIFNLTINIVLVNIIGLNGILISTIVSVLFITDFGYIHVLFKYYFKKSPKKYIMKQIIKAICFIAVAFITYILCININLEGIREMIIKGIIATIIPNIVFVIIWHKTEDFKMSYELLKKIINRKKGKI